MCLAVLIAGATYLWPGQDASGLSLTGSNMLGPLRDGSFMSVGAVYVRSNSDHPVLVLDARVSASRGVRVSNIGIARASAQSRGSRSGEHVPGIVDVHGFAVPPDDDGPDGPENTYVITAELRLVEDVEEGALLAMDVDYWDGLDVRTERVPMSFIVCPWIVVDQWGGAASCPSSSVARPPG